jgi:hypothetical protein
VTASVPVPVLTVQSCRSWRNAQIRASDVPEATNFQVGASHLKIAVVT